jgi:arylsulfatase A-like enzyme
MIPNMVSRRELMLGIPSALLAQAPRSAPPNIIVIVADDLGGRDLGCFGAADLKTPHLDALAAGGARWTNWYSNAPVCAPSRASILTGRYPQRAGVATNGRPLTADQKTIAEVLKPAGYATACIGKWHLGSTDESCPNGHGFDYFYGFHSGCVDFYSHRYYWGEPNRVNYHDLWRNRTEVFEDGQYLTERITQESLQYIERNKSKPFFMYIAYNAPHYPMHAPEKYMERFASLPLERRTYAAMIAAVDDGIGEIRGTLEQNRLFENTLIFFVGDNGATTEKRAGLNGNYATAGNNGIYRGWKFSLFDGGMHVPAIVSWRKRIAPKQTVSEIAMSMDILPTVCEAAGVSLPAGYTVDGSSVLPLASTAARSPHDAIFWEQGNQMAVRRGKWKLVLNGRTYEGSADGNKPLTGDDAQFLSDLENDPGETKNLRTLHPDVVDELSTLLHTWKKSM